jgi:hypothetical protein
VQRRLSHRLNLKRRQSIKLADNYASGASLLGSATHIRSAERAMLTATLEGFFTGDTGGGVLLLAGDAGSGKSELATLVPKSAKEHSVRLIESKSPKNKGSMSDIASNPCLEISQILRALLSPEAASLDGGDSRDKSKIEAASSTGPINKEEWQQLLVEALVGRPKLAAVTAHLFDAYFREWCGLPSEADEAKDAAAAEGLGPALIRQSSSFGVKPMTLGISEEDDSGNAELSSDQDLAQNLGDGPRASARRDVLGAVLERALAKEPLLIFVHVRTGSSLSAGSTHPEMWPLLQVRRVLLHSREQTHNP